MQQRAHRNTDNIEQLRAPHFDKGRINHGFATRQRRLRSPGFNRSVTNLTSRGWSSQSGALVQ